MLRGIVPGNRDAPRTVILLVVGLATLITLVTAFGLLQDANLGLDISDEGTYLAHAQPYSRAVGMSGFYGRYTSLLFDVAGNDVVWFRNLGLLIIVLASATGGAGMAAMATVRMERRLPPVPIGIATLVGANAGLLYYFPHLLTPSYNWMVLAAVTWTIGWLGLWWASAVLGNRRLAITAAASAATGMFFAGMAKAPAGPAMILAALIVAGVGALLVVELRPFLRGFFTVTGITLVAWLAFHFILRSGPSETLQIIRQVQEWNTLNDPVLYTFSGATRAMLQLLLEAPVLVARLSFGVALLPLMGPLVAGRPSDYSKRAPLYAAAVSGCIAATAFAGRWQGGGSGFFSLGDVTITLLVTVVAVAVTEIGLLGLAHYRGRFEDGPRTIEVSLLGIVGAIGVLAIPFGSNNGPLINSSISLGLVLVVAVVLLLAAGSDGLLIAATGLALVVALAAHVIVEGGRERPYRQQAAAEQTVPVALGVPQTLLLLDPQSAEYFERMKSHAKEAGFEPGTPLLDFTDFSTGTVWALGGRTPDTVFLGFGRHPDVDGWVTAGLERLDPDVFDDSWLLTGDLETSPNPKLLSVLDREFPADYVKIGEAVWWQTGETHTLWRPAQ